jgi:hypothetical protein
MTLGLQTSVANSSAAESNESIKTKAPATYYTQNRMITAEDYNISPLGINQEIVKVKAVNRSASGISRYFDLVDPTGKYSKTNLFADDGVLYKQSYTDSFRFKYSTRTDIEAVIYNQLTDTLKHPDLKNFYYANFDKKDAGLLNIKWVNTTVDTNQSTGYIEDRPTGTKQKVSTYTSTLLKFFTAGSLVKFIAPTIADVPYYFDKNNNNELKPIIGAMPTGSSTELWCKVVSIAGDGTANGTGVLLSGLGPIILNDIIPNNALVSKIIPPWRSVLEPATVTAMVDLIFSNKVFGLRYDTETRTWKIIIESNLNVTDPFSLGRQGDASNRKIDSSWLLLLTTDTEYYTVTSRLTRHIFESDQQIRFFFDSSDKVYDARINKTVKDVIKVLGINTDPATSGGTAPFTYDREWAITQEFKGADGYIDTKKIQITFNDSDDDGVVDDPTLFEQIVDLTNADLQKRYIILEKYSIDSTQEDYRYVTNADDKVIIADTEAGVNLANPTILDGQYFYFIRTNTVKRLKKISSEFITSLDYKVFLGRDNIKFQYIHNADYEARIDPGLTNLIDIFVLTKQYDIEYRQWLNGTVSAEPMPLSSDALYNLLSPDLNNIKSISDEIIYHPVKYKVLFGTGASSDVQATFKVVKNSEVVISDNDIKTRVLTAIAEFFSLENWEFGDNFYFSELSAYVMNRVAPNIVNFIIVPKDSDLTFGSLYEIRSEKDQIFINGATIDDIEIISAITASRINSAGNITMETFSVSQQAITSSTGGN